MAPLNLSYTEENYLKALLKLTLDSGMPEAGTNNLAQQLAVKPATANNMLKKLKEKALVDYEKYGKISLTAKGKKQAITVVRKHRLWETFLHEKLGFSWDEVHEVAEQMEHIQSDKLVERLDQFLGYPQFDPHGDPIPNHKGEMKLRHKKTLLDIAVGQSCQMLAVKDNSTAFLQYVAQIGISLNDRITVLSVQAYDSIIEIEVNGQRNTVSGKFAENIYVL